MLRKLDKYELLEEIGHGGMATVYKARDSRLDRMVAVKILHPHLQKTEEARSRFTREAQSVAKLAHANILEIYDYSGDESEESYIAAEFLTGPTLKRYVEDRTKLPPEVAAAFAIQIARALGAAHAAHIVHRDVKPENVLLHEDRCLKLTDFGIAQMVDAQSMTATGQILGSPGHMSPEQVATGDVDERSDIFSLGTVIYFMATGRLPFVGRNPHQILKRIVDGDFPDPARVEPAIGGEFAGIVRRSMAVEPDERAASADALEGELQRFLAGLDIEDSDALVREYLEDPESTTARLRENALSALMRRARSAVSHGVRGEAIECLNRVLAMDDGNVEALELTKKLGAERTFRPVRTALVLAGLVAIGGTVYALSDPNGVDVAADVDAGVALVSDLDGGADVGADTLAADVSDDLDSDTEGDTDANGLADAGAIDSGRRDTRGAVRPRGPSNVVFDFTPQNVQVSIDGSPLRAVGPGFSSIELDPGPHRFRVVGAQDCCVELDFRYNVPAGRERDVLSRSLAYRPAHFIVYSAVSGTVEIAPAGNTPGATHSTGSVFNVPLGSVRQMRRVTVRAPGHEPTSQNVPFRAGHTDSLRVTLTPSP